MKEFIAKILRYFTQKQCAIIVNGRELFVAKNELLTRQCLIELADLGQDAISKDGIDESKLRVTYNYDLCIPADYSLNEGSVVKAREGLIFWVTGSTPVW